jgi:hypothetical protein
VKSPRKKSAVMSRVKVELTPETEAVVVMNDDWTEDDPAYAQNSDGWSRILLEIRPH